MSWKGRDVVSILDFTRGDLEVLFREARIMEEYLSKGKVPRVLEGRIIALAFFEPSTRTRLSFEAAAKRLGAETIGFTAAEGTSIEKGENLADTIRMLDSYADAIVIRHKLEGSALFASEVAKKPVINGGDGRQHHPTQSMIDLYTILREKGRIDGLDYAVLGDLRYGRAASSFILSLTRFNIGKLYLVSPPQLRVRPEVKAELDASGISYEEVGEIQRVIDKIDVLYVTRVQKERFPDPEEYEKVKGSYRITRDLLRNARDDMIILHPLPRVDEISFDVDESKNARYFKQASYGVPVRMALLKLILEGCRPTG